MGIRLLFRKEIGNQIIEAPVASILEKSDLQQANTDNQPGKTNSISETSQIEPITEKLLSIQEELILPSKRIRTLVEISPVRQVESDINPVAITYQTLIESYIEEAKLSSQEEILFESNSFQMGDYSAIPNEESNTANYSGNNNILPQDNIQVIDEAEADAKSESETKSETATTTESESESESVIEEAVISDIQSEIIRHRKHVFSLSAAGITQAYAIRHVGVQSGFGYAYRFSPKWSLFLNSGMELRNIYHTNQQALIKETRLNSQAAEIGFSLNAKHNVAEVNYDFMISAYVGTGVRYNLTSKWLVYTGFTFHPLISLVKRSVSHLPTYADGSPNIEILYAEEIDSNYNMQESFDLSSTLGLTYFPRRRIGITIFYQHGFRGLLKYDLQNFDLSRRGIGIGIQYVL